MTQFMDYFFNKQQVTYTKTLLFSPEYCSTKNITDTHMFKLDFTHSLLLFFNEITINYSSIWVSQIKINYFWLKLISFEYNISN